MSTITADTVHRSFTKRSVLVIHSGTVEVQSSLTLQNYVARRTGLEILCIDIGCKDIPSCFSHGQMGKQSSIQQRLRNAKRKRKGQRSGVEKVNHMRRVFFLEILPTDGTKQILTAIETFKSTLQSLKRRFTKKLKSGRDSYVGSSHSQDHGRDSSFAMLPLLVIFAREREEPTSFWVIKSKQLPGEYLKLTGSVRSLRSEHQYGQGTQGTSWSALPDEGTDASGGATSSSATVPKSAFQPRFRHTHDSNGVSRLIQTDSHSMDGIKNNTMVTFVFTKKVPSPDQWAFPPKEALTFLENCYPKDTAMQRKSMVPVQHLKACLSDADLFYTNMTSGGAITGDDIYAFLYGAMKRFREEVPQMDCKNVQDCKAKQSMLLSEQRRNKGDIRVIRDSFRTQERSLDVLERISHISLLGDPTQEIGPMFLEQKNKDVQGYLQSVCENTGVFDLGDFPREGDGATYQFLSQRLTTALHKPVGTQNSIEKEEVEVFKAREGDTLVHTVMQSHPQMRKAGS